MRTSAPNRRFDGRISLRVLVIIGTRPEIVKTAPVVRALRRRGVETLVCFSGQHRELIGDTQFQLGLEPQICIPPLQARRALNDLFVHLVHELDGVLVRTRPDYVLVQGDTTTALAGTIVAFHHQVPVAHVEAGLRTFNLGAPWPEEMNRRAIDVASSLLFAPTLRARDNLAAERVHGRILVTGNTAIDALFGAVRQLEKEACRAKAEAELPPLRPGRRLIIVTGHRRETLGEGLLAICRGIAALSERRDVQIVYPTHLNPEIQGPVQRVLAGLPNVWLAPPLSYFAFVRLLQKAYLVITDSGGIQEEAPALGKPLLITRRETERPEVIETGAGELVGPQSGALLEAANRLLDDPAEHARRAQPRLPFGDGRAGRRIADAILGRPIHEFQPPVFVRRPVAGAPVAQGSPLLVS